MKKALAFAVATLATTSAFAAGKLIVRSDYVNTPNYKDTTGANIGGTSLLLPQVSRINADTKVGDATVEAHFNLRSFVLATEHDKDANKVMTVDKFVERLFISKPLGDFTVAVGKLYLNVGGFERDLAVEGDTYLTSLANNGAGGRATGATLTGTVGTVAMPENASAVGVAYGMGDHKVEVQVSNQTNAGTLNVDVGQTNFYAPTNRRHTIGALVGGSFMDKTLAYQVGYTSGAADRLAGAAAAFTGIEEKFMNLGVRYTGVANLRLDVEHINNWSKSKASGAKADSTVSNVVEARYGMGAYTPVFKYESSENKVSEDANNASSFKRTGMALAVEMMPKADDAFRYHVAYASAKDDYGLSTKKDVTFNQIMVGIKYSGNLW